MLTKVCVWLFYLGIVCRTMSSSLHYSITRQMKTLSQLLSLCWLMYRLFHFHICHCYIAIRTTHFLQIIFKSIMVKAQEYCSRMSSSPLLVDLLCSIHYTYHQKHDEIDRFEELITTLPIIAKLEDKFTPSVVWICDANVFARPRFLNHTKLHACNVHVAYWCYYCRVFHGGAETLQTASQNNQHQELNQFSASSTSSSTHHGASALLLCHWHHGTSVSMWWHCC